MLMRIAVLAMAILLSPALLRAEDVTGVVIASNVSSKGTVVELDVPMETDGKRLVLLWAKDTGATGYAPFQARGGTHLYEMRNIPLWQGSIKQLAVNLPGIKGRARVPSLTDELDLFFSPEWIQPSTINSVSPRTLFGWAWTTMLLVVFVGAVLVFVVIRKKPLAHALMLGFVVSWAVSDLRIVLDHAMVVRSQERRPFDMPPYEDAKTFGDAAAGIIAGKEWTYGSSGQGENFVWYRLAEQPFVSQTSPQASSSPDTLWVATKNDGADVLLERGTFRLFKKMSKKK